MSIRSTKDLRSFLVEQMEKAVDGDFDANKAKAMANFAQQIYNTLNIEVRVAVAKAKLGDSLSVDPVSFDD